MSTHPVAVKRRHDRRRNSRILIILLLFVMLLGALLAVNDLRPRTTVSGDSLAAQTTPELTFSSPNRRVTCQLTAEVARCMTVEPAYAPPIPCPGTMEVRVDAPAPVGTFVCNEGPIQTEQVLDYGDRVSRGDLTCHSYTAAMRCVHTVTQHGFSLSGDTYIVF